MNKYFLFGGIALFSTLLTATTAPTTMWAWAMLVAACGANVFNAWKALDSEPPKDDAAKVTSLQISQPPTTMTKTTPAIIVSLLIPALFLSGCANGKMYPQTASVISIALPIAEFVLAGVAQSKGVDPSNTAAITETINQLWGAYAAANTQQPAITGVSNPAAAAAITQAVPATMPSATQATLLAAAATALTK
jgi:hypothetical protein